MSLPRQPARIKKFPTYVLAASHDKADCKLSDTKEDNELKNLFAVDQMVQMREAIKYAEETLNKRNLKSFSPDELRHFIIELHRKCARSLVLLNNRARAGDLSTFRVTMRRETGIKGTEFDWRHTFSQTNYDLLKHAHNAQVANSYKKFCEALSDKIENTSFVDGNLGNLISEHGLDKHPGYEAFSLIFRFGEKPENMDKALREFCQTLWTQLQSAHIEPLHCAAYALFRLCQIHVFPNGNGRVSRILMNCVLMEYGINPVRIDVNNKPHYFHAVEHSTLEDFRPIKKFIKGNLNKSYSEDLAEPMFPDDRVVNFALNWDLDNKNQSAIFPEYYDVIQTEHLQKYYLMARTERKDSMAPLPLKLMASNFKERLILSKIDGDYCESKARLYEKAGNLTPAVYYFQRAADFCREAKTIERANKLAEESENLRLKLIGNSPAQQSAEKKPSAGDEKSSDALPSQPVKVTKTAAIDAWQELKAIIDKKKKVKKAADKPKIVERLVAVLPRLVFDKHVIESAGLTLSIAYEFLNRNRTSCEGIANFENLLKQFSGATAEMKNADIDKRVIPNSSPKYITIAGINIVGPLSHEEEKKIDWASAVNSGTHPASFFYMPSGISVNNIVIADEKNPQADLHPAAFLPRGGSAYF